MEILGVTRHEVVAAFYPDVDDSTTNVVATAHRAGHGWSIVGNTTIGTDLVASFKRSIYQGPGPSGLLVASHLRLDVEPLFQQSGYAKALLTQSFALYKRLKVAYVELNAVEDGALVWPRLGWSLHGPSISEVHAEIIYTYAGRHGVRPPASFQLPIFGPDILELEDGTGWRVGEEALKNFARSNREISMRLYLSSHRAIASLSRRGMV